MSFSMVIGRHWAWPALFLSGISWGASFSLAKIATQDGAHPFSATFWQFAIAAAMLLAIFLVSRQRLSLGIGHIGLYVTCALLGLVIPTILFFYAAPEVSPGVIAIAIGTVPLMTALAASTLGIDRLSFLRVVGILLGVLSVLLLTVPSVRLPGQSAIPWILLTLVAALCFTAQNLVIALRKPAALNSYTLACGMLLAAAIIMVPIVILTGTFEALLWPWDQTEWAIVLRAVISVVGHGLLILLVTKAGPVFASQTSYIITIAGVGWGIILFDEQHPVWIWLALITMLCALSLVKPRTAAQAKRT